MKAKDGQKGFSLIENLLGVALIGIVAVAFIHGLSTSLRGVSVSQERVTAESLAKSQAEYTMSDTYISVADYDPGDPEKRYEVIEISPELIAAGYSVNISTPQQVIPLGEAGFELQSVNITAERNNQDKQIITIYKLNE